MGEKCLNCINGLVDFGNGDVRDCSICLGSGEVYRQLINKNSNSAMKTPERDYDREWEEMQPHELCPRCGRDYNDIDIDYQSCSKCGWDDEKEKFNSKLIIKPTEDDYLNGDADILTGRWN